MAAERGSFQASPFSTFIPYICPPTASLYRWPTQKQSNTSAHEWTDIDESLPLPPELEQENGLLSSCAAAPVPDTIVLGDTSSFFGR